MDSLVIPEGYKQTEAGVIPDNWDVIKIGKICDISVGQDVDPNYSSESDSKYCYPVFSNTVDVPGIYGYYTYPEYSGEVVTVVGRGVGLGTAICRSGGFGAIGRLIVLFPKKGVNNKFLANYINHMIDVFSESSGVPQLTGIAFANYSIAYPSSAEQTAIANALSDVDALITSLESLITKKRAIKTAAMQQLLTGKKRLPPFCAGMHLSGDAMDGKEPVDKTHTGYKQTELGEIPEDWEIVELGKALSIRHGKSQKEIGYENGIYPILATGGEIGRTNTALYNKPSVLIGRKGTIDKPVYMDSPFWTVDTLFYSEISEGYQAKFIYYKFCVIDWMSYNEASGVPSLNASTIEAVLQAVPTNLEEQKAIANILSDMDKEVDALNKRLTKTQQLKQGMMQQLLTGKTRLI